MYYHSERLTLSVREELLVHSIVEFLEEKVTQEREDRHHYARTRSDSGSRGAPEGERRGTEGAGGEVGRPGAPVLRAHLTPAVPEVPPGSPILLRAHRSLVGHRGPSGGTQVHYPGHP